MTRTPILGESQSTRVPNRLAKPSISDVNLDQYSSMPSMKGMDTVEASSEYILLPTEVGINQVGESDKVSNSRR